MSGGVGGDPVAMAAAAGAIADETTLLRRVGWDVEDAVHAFLRSSSEGMPSISDHEEAFEQLVAGLRSVQQLVEATSQELARVDGTLVRRWLPGHDSYGRYEGWQRTILDVHSGGPEAVPWLPAKDAVDAASDLWSTTGALAQQRGWNGVLRWMDRLAGRTERFASQLAGPASAMWRTARSSAPALTRIADRATRLATSMQSTSTWARASSAASSVGRVLPFAGAGVSVVTAAATLLDDEASTEDKVLSGLSAVGSVALLATGPVAAVGAVVVAGVLIYEHREAIADGAREARDWAADTAGDLLDGARSLLDGLF